jgi:hypothetical protein
MPRTIMLRAIIRGNGGSLRAQPVALTTRRPDRTGECRVITLTEPTEPPALSSVPEFPRPSFSEPAVRAAPADSYP